MNKASTNVRWFCSSVFILIFVVKGDNFLNFLRLCSSLSELTARLFTCHLLLSYYGSCFLMSLCLGHQTASYASLCVINNLFHLSHILPYFWAFTCFSTLPPQCIEPPSLSLCLFCFYSVSL